MAKQTAPGFYYSQYHDETWEQAVDAHSVGFTSVREAIEEMNSDDRYRMYFVKDHAGNVVYCSDGSYQVPSNGKERIVVR